MFLQLWKNLWSDKSNCVCNKERTAETNTIIICDYLPSFAGVWWVRENGKCFFSVWDVGGRTLANRKIAHWFQSYLAFMISSWKFMLTILQPEYAMHDSCSYMCAYCTIRSKILQDIPGTVCPTVAQVTCCQLAGNWSNFRYVKRTPMDV